jgi:hypothetical protein
MGKKFGQNMKRLSLHPGNPEGTTKARQKNNPIFKVIENSALWGILAREMLLWGDLDASSTPQPGNLRRDSTLL